jgi:hypothetical protein
MKLLSRALLFAAALLSVASAAVAQTYPTTTPTYTPTAILSPQTALTAPGDVNFYSNNLGTVTFNVTGTNTGVVLSSRALPNAPVRRGIR